MLRRAKTDKISHRTAAMAIAVERRNGQDQSMQAGRGLTQIKQAR